MGQKLNSDYMSEMSECNTAQSPPSLRELHCSLLFRIQAPSGCQQEQQKFKRDLRRAHGPYGMETCACDICVF